jgi:hypothetical protein
MDIEGKLLISDVLCEVRKVVSYELNGHIFAYETRSSIVNVDTRGNRETSGAMFNPLVLRRRWRRQV